VVIALFHQLHDELREEIESRSDDALNWVPCTGANSVATIITHMLGSEVETLRAVAGDDTSRDREAEFHMGLQSSASLSAQIDRVQDLLHALAPRLNEERAASLMALPTLPSDELRFGTTWLIGNLAHAREHMGHLRLTAQLYGSEKDGRA
jgi:hypothetical protein